MQRHSILDFRNFHHSQIELRNTYRECGFCNLEYHPICPHGTLAHLSTTANQSDVDEFWLSKSQKRVLKRMNNFLATGAKPRGATAFDAESQSGRSLNAQSSTTKLDKPTKIKSKTHKGTNEASNEKKTVGTKKIVDAAHSTGCLKNKLKRRQRKLDKLAKNGLPAVLVTRENVRKTIEQILNENSSNVNKKHDLTVRLVRSQPPSEEFQANFAESFALYRKYQTEIQKYDESDLTDLQYYRLFCDSPLVETKGHHADHPGYGSFHQQYLLDGKLVAVGVLDILSFCVSVKYFYYDPAYSFLRFDDYFFLRGIELVRRLSLLDVNLRFYFIGFEIFNFQNEECEALYSPSYSKCHGKHIWRAIHKCLPLLEGMTDCRLNEVPTAEYDVALGRVLRLYIGSAFLYSIYKRLGIVENMAEVKECTNCKKCRSIAIEYCTNTSNLTVYKHGFLAKQLMLTPCYDPNNLPTEEDLFLLVRNEIRIPSKAIKKQELVGSGNFGKVFKAKYINPQGVLTIVALKTLPFGTKNVRLFVEEGLRMELFKHCNVMSLIGIAFNELSYPMIVTPFMKHGDLLFYVQNEKNEPTVRQLLNWAVEIIEGLKYLHQLKLIHRDLAARNCMLDEKYRVKIGDFGLSRELIETDCYLIIQSDVEIPYRWCAPESVERSEFSSKSDIVNWSFGVTIWELFTRGSEPYADMTTVQILEFLNSDRRLEKPVSCPDQTYQLMEMCWDRRPHYRPDCVEISITLPSIIRMLECNILDQLLVSEKGLKLEKVRKST